MFIAGAVTIASVAFVFARPGGGEQPPASTSPGPSLMETTDPSPTDAGTSAPPTRTSVSTVAPDESPLTQSAEPELQTTSSPTEAESDTETLTRVRIENSVPVGGIQEIRARKGDQVGFDVLSDLPSQIHLHSYDITRNAAPGNPARFRFRAEFEGVFDVEAHDAGHVIVARVVVEP